MPAPWSYRVIPDGKRFAVVCIHDETPDWWHVIARFDNKDRADRYAEVEGDITSDQAGLEPEKGWDGDELPAPVARLPAPPPTRVDPANFRLPSPAEKARVGTALVAEAAEEAGVTATVTLAPPAKGRRGSNNQPEPLPTPASPIAEDDQPEPRKPRGRPRKDLSDNAMNLWRAITKLRDQGKDPAWGALAEMTGIAKGSRGYLLGVLQDRGLITDGLRVKKRPPDMPEPKPAVKAQATVIPPQPATVREVIRFLAKDVGLVVMGPDDDRRWCIEKKTGLDDDAVVTIANEHRRRRALAPYKLTAGGL